MATFRTVDAIAPAQRLLVRVDLNTAVEDGVVQDGRRFSRHADTVGALLGAEHAVALLAHQGRPGGETFRSLDQHAPLLGGHLDREVGFVPDTYGPEALAAIDALDAGEVLLLENVRMCADELPEEAPAVKATTPMVRALAPAFDAYVNDAYSVAHRSHASIVGFPLVMDAYAGPMLDREYTAVSAVRERSFEGPVAMVLGGTKAEDAVPVVERLADGVERVCLGGVVGELFLRGAGHDLGYDVEGTALFDHQWEALEATIGRLLEAHGDRLCLPVDLAYEADGARREVAVGEAAKRRPYLDVGADTIERFVERVADAEAVFVKGPLGVFEDERFAAGTVEVLGAIATAECFSVVGGGDTARAIDLYGLDAGAFSHVSLAGGAYVRALAGDPLVGVEVLSTDR